MCPAPQISCHRWLLGVDVQNVKPIDKDAHIWVFGPTNMQLQFVRFGGVVVSIDQDKQVIYVEDGTAVIPCNLTSIFDGHVHLLAWPKVGDFVEICGEIVEDATSSEVVGHTKAIHATNVVSNLDAVHEIYWQLLVVDRYKKCYLKHKAIDTEEYFNAQSIAPKDAISCRTLIQEQHKRQTVAMDYVDVFADDDDEIDDALMEEAMLDFTTPQKQKPKSPDSSQPIAASQTDDFFDMVAPQMSAMDPVVADSIRAALQSKRLSLGELQESLQGKHTPEIVDQTVQHMQASMQVFLAKGAYALL
eukprot:Clim_evm67s153 gene=Clim_evmTU67s153